MTLSKHTPTFELSWDLAGKRYFVQRVVSRLRFWVREKFVVGDRLEIHTGTMTRTKSDAQRWADEYNRRDLTQRDIYSLGGC